ncbi:MAG TPA: FmdE family protein [Thermodesulfovibrionia bacterium]|nr:FmdE family protein [Thermodesulfovibrionia bacterium]
MKIPDKVREFHGHVCPGVAYGVRVASVVLQQFGQRAEDEELVAIVENDSCAVDAIQVMTGCTFGKGNLLFKDYGKQVYTFFKRSSKEGLRIAVKGIEYPETDEQKALWKQFRSGDKRQEVVRAVEAMKAEKISLILSADEQAVLTIAKISVELPPEAKIYPSLRCSTCGEKVMESRIRVRHGQYLCIPCEASEGLYQKQPS